MKNYITALVIVIAALFSTATAASATSTVASGYVRIMGDSVSEITSDNLLSMNTRIWVNQMTRGLRVREISVTVLYDGNRESRELRFTHEQAGFLIEVVMLD